MLVTLLDMVMLLKLLQEENAEFPILVTLFGMVMLVNFLQEENAWLPIDSQTLPVSNSINTSSLLNPISPLAFGENA